MENIFYEVIKILDEINLTNNIVIIGSWAEFIYEKSSIIKDFQSNIRTKDIDLLIENINLPREKIDILKAFEEKGFEIDVTGFDVYKLIKGEFEIEFLGEMKGGSYSYTKVPSLNIPKIEVLTHVSMLYDETLKIEYKNINIKIPNPYNYVLHKMIINNDRKEKKDKDKRSISNLLIYLNKVNDEKIFLYYFNKNLSKKEKKSVLKYISENNLKHYFQRLINI